MATGRYVPADRATRRRLLKEARVVAVVGMSDDPMRASHRIGRFLQRVGYTVYPVNPTIERIGDDRVYPGLDEVPESIDIVNVFRRSEYLAGVVEDAIAADARAVWAQLGIYDEEAGLMAQSAGLDIVMNDCIMVTYNELLR